MVGNNFRAPTAPLYRLHELAIRTLYAEIKDRVFGSGPLLPGTPGTLVKRSGTGSDYWYRSYYPLPKKRAEDFVGLMGDVAAHGVMQDRISQSIWTHKQVSALAKLGYQVADKGAASVLVELHNRRVFEAGLVVVGTLAYMSWLNEFGARANAARTQDIDLARRQTLKLAASSSFLTSMQATQLPFAKVPGMPSKSPSTSVKLPGAEGLRVDMLAPGPVLGAIIAVPELEWHAQTIPFYEYMLQDSRTATMLAGGHCIPIMLPDVSRMIWHKLYSSTHRLHDSGKAEKDLVQAVTLAAIVVEQDNLSLEESFREAPPELRTATHARLPRIKTLLAEHPQVWDAFERLSVRANPG